MLRLRRACLVLGAVAAAWAIAVWLTGGLAFEVHSWRLSSRSPVNPALIALGLGLAFLAVSTRGGLRRQLHEDRVWLAGLGLDPLRLRAVDPIVVSAAVAIAIQVAQWAVARPLWLDEEMVALNVRDRSLVDLAGALWMGQSAPLGWLAIQRAVLLTLGAGEHALRLVPLFSAVATSIVAAWIARRWMGTLAGALFVILCAVGPWLSWYQLEFKHYSTDILFGLLLPALGAWVATEDGRSASSRVASRAALWWTAAAVGQWFANAALLVVPGCAVVLVVARWRRGGMRSAGAFAVWGLVFAAAFALHYVVSVQYTLNSEYLHSYWAAGMPPAAAGAAERLAWLVAQLPLLADNPGGTSRWILFWGLAGCGLALGRRPLVGALMVVVPISAFVFAAMRLVPVTDRLALWALPAMYFGIASAVDAGVRLGWEGLARRRWISAAAAAGLLVAAVPLWTDLLGESWLAIQYELSVAPRSNHGLDDRTAVRWLMRQRRPGDVFLTTRLALPAVWWYGRIPIAAPGAGRRLPDGAPIMELSYVEEGGCHPDVRESLAGRRRALIYFGFGFDDVPRGFERLVLDRLRKTGDVSAYRSFGDVGAAAVVDFEATPAPHSILPDALAGRDGLRDGLGGCVAVQPAARW